MGEPRIRHEMTGWEGSTREGREIEDGPDIA